MEDIFLKINLLKLIKDNDNNYINKIDIIYNIENLFFPLNLTIDIIDNLIKIIN